MINTTETLRKIHERFPNMTLEMLLDILDCIVLDSNKSDIVYPYQLPGINSPYVQPNTTYPYVWCQTQTSTAQA